MLWDVITRHPHLENMTITYPYIPTHTHIIPYTDQKTKHPKPLFHKLRKKKKINGFLQISLYIGLDVHVGWLSINCRWCWWLLEIQAALQVFGQNEPALISASFHLLSDVSVLEAIIANILGILFFLQKAMYLYASLLALFFSHRLNNLKNSFFIQLLWEVLAAVRFSCPSDTVWH